MRCTVKVSQEAALQRGSDEWGDVLFELPPLLRLLTEEERVRLRPAKLPGLPLRAESVDTGDQFPVEATSASPEDVAAALRHRWEEQTLGAQAKCEERRDMYCWIGEHGSARLRAGASAGYDCHGLYVDERCTLEMPGWRPIKKVDELRDRANPEASELAAAEKEGAEICWLRDEGMPRPVLLKRAWGARLLMEVYPACGHLACRQHWIDTGDVECVEGKL